MLRPLVEPRLAFSCRRRPTSPRSLRTSFGFFLNAEFSDPWCVAAQLKPEYCAPFIGSTSNLILYHYVVDGRLNVQVEGEERFGLSSGEVVMFPHNDAHLLGSQLDLPPTLASDVIVPSASGGLYAIRHGGDGALTPR